MVSVRRCRAGTRNGPDSTVRRCRGGLPYTVRRCNDGPLYTVRRCKGRVFDGRALPVGATLEALGCPWVVAGQAVEGLPGDGKPTGLVWPVTFDGFVNESSLQQFALCASDDIGAFPATRGQVCARRQQTPVVVSDELTCELQQQGARRVAQTGKCRAIQYGSRQGDKAPCIPP